MKALLDTHAFLWFVFDDPRLSKRAAEVIADRETSTLLSVATLWETTIKSQLGKLELGVPLEVFLKREVEERLVELIAIQVQHLVVYDRLPLHHRDPFDRLLVAQAKSLGAPVVTSDSRFEPYGVVTVW